MDRDLMELLVTYDVDTSDRDGERRLRQVAKICEGIGHRVQKSVFEVVCSPAQRLELEARLLRVIDPKSDSVRFYQFPQGTYASARHLGASTTPQHAGALII